MLGTMDSEYQNGLKYLRNPPICTEDNQTKIPRNLNIWHDQTWPERIGKLLLKNNDLEKFTTISLDFHLGFVT
jgi:hypothetical protein